MGQYGPNKLESTPNPSSTEQQKSMWSNTDNAAVVDWQGMYGISDEVYLSLPCVLNSGGVASVVNMTLTHDEVAQLQGSADTLWGIQKDLKDI